MWRVEGLPGNMSANDNNKDTRDERCIRPNNMADEDSFGLYAPATGKSIADTRCRVISRRTGLHALNRLTPLARPQSRGPWCPCPFAEVQPPVARKINSLWH